MQAACDGVSLFHSNAVYKKGLNKKSEPNFDNSMTIRDSLLITIYQRFL
jgi:hypothetical protein